MPQNLISNDFAISYINKINNETGEFIVNNNNKKEIILNTNNKTSQKKNTPIVELTTICVFLGLSLIAVQLEII